MKTCALSINSKQNAWFSFLGQAGILIILRDLKALGQESLLNKYCYSCRLWIEILKHQLVLRVSALQKWSLVAFSWLLEELSSKWNAENQSGIYVKISSNKPVIIWPCTFCVTLSPMSLVSTRHCTISKIISIKCQDAFISSNRWPSSLNPENQIPQSIKALLSGLVW